MIDAMRQLAQTSRQMRREIGRELTPEELAEKLAMRSKGVRRVLDIAKEPLSLDLPIGEEEDSRLSDLSRTRTRSHHSIPRSRQSGEATTQVLACLTPREERIMRMRFGIGMDSDHTLAEVGKQFSVTRERIRRSRPRRSARLKHPTTRASCAAFSYLSASSPRVWSEVLCRDLRKHLSTGVPCGPGSGVPSLSCQEGARRECVDPLYSDPPAGRCRW